MTWIEFERVKGDRPMIDEDEHPGIKQIKSMYDSGRLQEIDEMVKLWMAMKNLGMLGGLLKRFLIWSGIIAVSALAASGWLTEYIKGIR
jgi:hypothetical protein